MKKILYRSFFYTVMVGLIATIPFVLEINGMTPDLSIISQRYTYIGTYRWEYYYLDFAKFLQNLEESVNLAQFQYMIQEIPTRPSMQDVISAIINYIIYGINWIIYIINITFYPTKLILYPVNILLALFGYNTSNEDWIATIKTMYSLNIPYIPYIVIT